MGSIATSILSPLCGQTNQHLLYSASASIIRNGLGRTNCPWRPVPSGEPQSSAFCRTEFQIPEFGWLERRHLFRKPIISKWRLSDSVKRERSRWNYIPTPQSSFPNRRHPQQSAQLLSAKIIPQFPVADLGGTSDDAAQKTECGPKTSDHVGFLENLARTLEA